ncbi:MAG: hypothetical protein WCI45_05585 [Desulfuromonadales bacterium]
MSLSFTEKRGYQKTVTTNLAVLAAGGVSFSNKRKMQKETTDALTKLGENPTVNPDNFGAPTVADVGKVLETQQWQNMSGMGEKAWETTPEFKEGITTNYELVGTDEGDNGATMGYFLLSRLDKGAFVPLGGSVSLSGNTVEDVISAIDTMIADYEKEVASNNEAVPVIVQNQKLTDLLSGKYNDEKPEVFIKLVKDVIDEIKEIDPVKPALLSYIEAAKAKGIISESAVKALEAILES